MPPSSLASARYIHVHSANFGAYFTVYTSTVNTTLQYKHMKTRWSGELGYLKVVREVDQEQMVVLGGCYQLGEVWGDRHEVEACRANLREQLL